MAPAESDRKNPDLQSRTMGRRARDACVTGSSAMEKSCDCSQAVLPVMRAQGGGSIVNISMTLHYRGWPLMAHATAAKAGVDALTRTRALEWAKDKVRINAVAPGPIPTEGVRKAFTPPPAADGVPDVFAVEKAMDSYARKMIPMQRWGLPADIANMVVFLASPAALWITGAIMVVDGGEWLAKPQPAA